MKSYTLDGRSTINFAVTICRLQIYLQIHKKQRDFWFLSRCFTVDYSRVATISVFAQSLSAHLRSWVFSIPGEVSLVAKFKGTDHLSLVGLDVVVESCCCSCFILILLLMIRMTSQLQRLTSFLPAYLQRQSPGGYIQHIPCQIQSKRQKYPVNTKKH